MKTTIKILLFIGGAFALIVLAFAAFVMWINLDEQYAKDFQIAQIEGQAFGVKTDNNGCIKEGLVQAKDTPFTDLKKTSVTGVFVEECLKASRPVNDFCQGVPSITDFDEMDWRIEECRRSGLDDLETACLAVFDKKRFYCINNKK